MNDMFITVRFIYSPRPILLILEPDYDVYLPHFSEIIDGRKTALKLSNSTKNQKWRRKTMSGTIVFEGVWQASTNLGVQKICFEITSNML